MVVIMKDSESKLDDLLRAWSSRNLATRTDLDHLRSLLERNGEQIGIGKAVGRSRLRSRWIALTAVAAVLFLAATLSMLQFAKQSDETPAEIVEPYMMASLQLVPREIAARSELYGELKRLFGPQLNWMAEAKDSVELGLQPPAVATSSADSASKLMLVRMTVVRLNPPDNVWYEVWSVDFVTRCEQVVRCQPITDGPILNAWLFALPDAKVACDAELEMNNGGGWKISTSTLQAVGELQQVTSVQHDNVEYRVFQTVQTLEIDEVT